MKKLLFFAILIAVSCISFGQNYKKINSIEGGRVIESRTPRGHYLSLDSRYFHSGLRGSTVNVQNKMSTQKLLEIKKLADGSYSIASTFFKKRYLRMDGGQINSSSKTSGEVVDGQTYASRKVGVQNRARVHKKSHLLER